MKRTGLPRTDRPLSGPQHYWDRMIALTAETGGFTITDVQKTSNGPEWRTVQTYVLWCASEGFIDPIGTEPTCKNREAVRYAVKVTRAEAPVERRYPFADIRGRSSEQLWRAMRSLQNFTARELAIAAATDDVPIGYGTAKDFIQSLNRGGYLHVIEPSRSRKPATYRLKPSMNSGPKPPAVKQDGTVIDRNRKTIVHQAVGAQA